VAAAVDPRCQLIEEEIARNLDGLEDARCGKCGALMFRYQPPIHAVLTCRRCKAWNWITRAERK